MDIKNQNQNTFADYISRVLIEFKGAPEFPKDDNVKRSILEKDLYKSILAKFILTKLELFNSKEKIDIDNITIEHIMPRTLTDNWKNLIGETYKDLYEKYINTIGNLTLTGFNPELSNKSLEEKILIYKDSKFHFLNEDLLKLNSWNEEIIINRAKRLTNKLLEYYPYPNIVNIDSNNVEEYYLDDSIDFRGINILSFEYKNIKYDANKWAIFYTKILDIIYVEDSMKFTNLILKNEDFKNKINDKEFPDNYSRVYKTENGFFINMDNDTNTKVKLLLNVLDKLNINSDEITLYVKRANNIN